MKISFLLVFLQLFFLISSTHIDNKNILQKIDDEDDDPQIIVKTKEQLEAEKEKYKTAEDIFSQNPNGRDYYEEIVVGDVFLRTIQLSPHLNEGETGESLDPLRKFILRVNSHNLYYGNGEKSYRGVMGAIALENIVSGSDEPLMGKCCERVTDVERREERTPKRTVFYCFQVHTVRQLWDICSLDKEEAETWKSKIVTEVILNFLRRNGIFDEKPLLQARESMCDKVPNWSWNDQEEWPCFCGSGSHQSPINIIEKKTIPIRKAKMLWEYIPAQAAVAEFDGHQVFVNANFGKFVHVQKEGRKNFLAYSVTFKFPSEHKLEGHFKSGEMLVYHKNDQDELAILSIFLEVSNDVEDIDFINKLMPEIWEKNIDKPQCIDSLPNIEWLIKEGVSLKFDKSFYWYKGSDTTPPCKENVERFVMKAPLKIPKLQFDKLRDKTIEDSANGKNNREIQLVKNRKVYYHEENGELCNFSELDIEKEVEDKIVDKPKPKQFIRAISEGFATLPFEDSVDLGNGIHLEIVDPQNIPENIRKKLTKGLKKEKKSIKEMEDDEENENTENRENDNK